MELQELIRGEAECCATIGDNEVNFIYRPGLITIEYTNTMDVSYAGMGQALEDLIVSWDLTQDGEPLEINKEVINRLPIEWVMKISDAIFDDVRSEKN